MAAVAGVFEVFRRGKSGGAMEHAGSLEAPDARLAESYARQLFGRRGEAAELWVVARAAIAHTVGASDELDHSYRRVDGYSIRDRLRAARAAAGVERGQFREGAQGDVDA